MEIHQNHFVEIPLWESLVKESEFLSPFQVPEFYGFCHTMEHFTADVFAVNESGRYTTLVVVTLQKEKGAKGFFSKRGIIYGGPLVGEGCTSLGFLLDSVRDYYQGKLIYLETRNFFDYKNFRSDFSAAGWSYIPYLNVKVQIKDRSLDEIISLFNYNRRRQVRKSLAEGATWTEVNTVSRIQAIYRILFHLYKTKVRLPLPPEDFFIKFWQSGLMKAFAVEHNGKIIGGSFSPVLPGKCVYTMYYCGERDYHPRIFPTHLAVLAVMDYGQKAGCRYLDFMGAGKPGVEYGVRNYKMEFGGDLIEEGRYLLVLNPFMYKLGKLGLTMLSRKGV